MRGDFLKQSTGFGIIRGKSCQRQPHMGQDFPRGVLGISDRWHAGVTAGCTSPKRQL